ncbi:MAG: triose-phosphate isomerase [candidate division NC10 bacterium]|nr:triose-phosphate isomerase [candidate division NC10 bacterium]
MRIPLIVGNWKMFKTTRETVGLVAALVKRLKDMDDVEVAICPPFTALQAAAAAIGGSKIALGAQDLYWEEEGAYTGEVSAPMLLDVGCRYVIVGHSERRRHFGETDTTVSQKAKAALKHSLFPIVCVGELLAEREAGRTFQVLEKQVTGGLAGLTRGEGQRLVVAYEPVWAIGTGRTATPDQANEAQGFIRKLLAELFDQAVAHEVRILYGGSVKPENIRALMGQPEVDGALVGGASLDADSFAKIVTYRQ